MQLSPWRGDCVERVYNRLNADYEVMHKLCRFFLDSTGPTQKLGTRGMMPFLVNMAALFEKFVAQWLTRKMASQYLLKRQESLTLGEKGGLRMVMDLVLYDRRTQQPLCVLDTKYKTHNTVRPEDYNQVVAYADALHCDTAILIYPQPFVQTFDEKKGRVRVKAVAFDINDDLIAAGNNLLSELYNCIFA